MNSTFTCVRVKKDGGRSSKFGNSILVSFPIKSSRGIHLCTGEGGRGESSMEGEERPLPRRHAALSAICRSGITLVNLKAFTFSVPGLIDGV